MNRPSHFILIVFLLISLAKGAMAHPPGLSSMEVTSSPANLSIKVTFATQDIEALIPMDIDLDAEVTPQELTDAKPAIAELIRENLHVKVDGELIQPKEMPGVEFDDQNNARVALLYPAHPKEELSIESTFLKLFPDGHQQFIAFRSDSDTVVAEKMLKKTDMKFNVSLSQDTKTETVPISLWPAFTDFFKLGVEHILTGYDHLLFLFALLAVTHSFWPALKIITFFTIAHSITLALAGLELFELRSTIVEPLIALTIVYVSVENMIRGEQVSGRHWLTFGFGLIHGFGFAGVLKEMEISTGNSGILLPLFSFNLGIESGQIAVTSVVLPLIWWINNTSPHANQIFRAGSALIALLGSYWFLERVVFSWYA